MLNSHDPSPNVGSNGSAPSKPSRADVEVVVIDTLAELTRYPRDILTLDADLDTDLGIDSLKRIEIVDALLDRLGRTPPDDPSELGDSPRTVGELVEVAVREVAKATNGAAIGPLNGAPSAVVRESVDAREAAPAPPRLTTVAATPAKSSNGAGIPAVPSRTQGEIESIVIDVIAEATRYPRDILVPDARFDEDLGVDSLKRIEIVTSLFERFGQPQVEIEELDQVPRSIRELTALVSVRLNAETSRSLMAAVVAKGPDLSMRSHFPNANSGASAILRRRTRGLDRPFDGEIALVSNAIDGAGAAIARRLATLGASVIVTSASKLPSSGASANTADLAATYLPGSCAKSADVERIFAEIETRFGRLDHYVYNAASGSEHGSPEEQWDEALRSNIWGYRLSALRAAKLMAKNGGGHIVALSSHTEQNGLRSAVSNPARAAFESLTRELAHEFVSFAVNVNAISFTSGAHAVPYAADIDAFAEVTEAALFLLTRNGRSVNASVLRFDEVATPIGV